MLVDFLVLEITSVKHRATAGMLHAPAYGLGAIFVTILAQYINDWRHFQLACACIYILGIPYYW